MIEFKIKKEFAKALWDELADLILLAERTDITIKSGNTAYFLQQLSDMIMSEELHELNTKAAQEQHDK